MRYQLITTDGRAKRAHMETVHGTIETPVFMNVGTVAAIKGAVSTDDLRQIGTQVELSNTYHLHVRTGDTKIRQFGGLHKFMNWDRPILTDSVAGAVPEGDGQAQRASRYGQPAAASLRHQPGRGGG